MTPPPLTLHCAAPPAVGEHPCPQSLVHLIHHPVAQTRELMLRQEEGLAGATWASDPSSVSLRCCWESGTGPGPLGVRRTFRVLLASPGLFQSRRGARTLCQRAQAPPPRAAWSVQPDVGSRSEARNSRDVSGGGLAVSGGRGGGWGRLTSPGSRGARPAGQPPCNTSKLPPACGFPSFLLDFARAGPGGLHPAPLSFHFQ